MSNMRRRDGLIGSAPAAAAVAAAKPAAAGDPSFMNNVPDPLVSGDDLPTFKEAADSYVLTDQGRKMLEALMIRTATRG